MRSSRTLAPRLGNPTPPVVLALNTRTLQDGADIGAWGVRGRSESRGTSRHCQEALRKVVGRRSRSRKSPARRWRRSRCSTSFGRSCFADGCARSSGRPSPNDHEPCAMSCFSERRQMLPPERHRPVVAVTLPDIGLLLDLEVRAALADPTNTSRQTQPLQVFDDVIPTCQLGRPCAGLALENAQSTCMEVAEWLPPGLPRARHDFEHPEHSCHDALVVLVPVNPLARPSLVSALVGPAET